VGDLTQGSGATENANGEQLAVFVGVGPERVGRGQEERACSGGVQERGDGVLTAEVRELTEILAVPYEDLSDREVAEGSVFHRSPR